MKPSPQDLPGPPNYFRKSFPKSRAEREGREYANPKHRAFLKKFPGALERTVRCQQNYICAERAWLTIVRSDNAEALTKYFNSRSTLLVAIGHIEERELRIQAAARIFYYQLRGERARAEIRKIRYGDWWPDITILSRKIWKAVCEYHNLYPYQTDEKIVADLKIIIHRCNTAGFAMGAKASRTSKKQRLYPHQAETIPPSSLHARPASNNPLRVRIKAGF